MPAKNQLHVLPSVVTSCVSCVTALLSLSCHQVELFNLAVKAQVHGVKVCSEGMGVERHFYSLKCLAEERGIAVPKLLRSKVPASFSFRAQLQLQLCRNGGGSPRRVVTVRLTSCCLAVNRRGTRCATASSPPVTVAIRPCVCSGLDLSCLTVLASAI